MKKLAVVMLLTLIAVPVARARGFTPGKITVDQLRQMVAELHGKSDKKIAAKLGDLKLSERLSRAAYQELSKELPGKRSRMALLSVADASAFLDPPASEMLPDAAPDGKQQREILKRAVEFTGEQADELPAFQAIRTTQHFQDVRVYPYSNKIEYYTPGSFRWLEMQVDDVRCAAGGDEAQVQPDLDLDRRMARQWQPFMYMSDFGYHTIWGSYTWNIPNTTQEGYRPSGAFGPWLQAVSNDASGADATWAYWERSGSTRLAVFRFTIPRAQAHYAIQYFFAPSNDDRSGHEYSVNPGYHGEVAIDPASGEVARIVVIADFAKGEPMTTANIELEYAPVTIEGKSYLLPVRGVSITSFPLSAYLYQLDSGNIGHQVDHYPVTSVDDISFSDYGVVKPRVRILPLESLDGPSR